MHAMILLLAVAAPPTPMELALLKTFRNEFVVITPGKGPFPRSFRMGGAEPGEGPSHEVTFDYEFAVARYEVPQNLWQAVMGNNPSRWKGERNSVEMVTFDDAVEFCRRVTTRLREAKLIDADQEIRLPSEAEWEYCARAGTTTAYSFGDDPAELGKFGWFTGNAAGNDPPVGTKQPNPWGLYDVHGYLWEWCTDAAHDDYQGAPTDGSPWIGGSDPQRRVIRGGSWKDEASGLRSACRSGRIPHRDAPDGPVRTLEFRGGVSRDLADDAVGLRCVLARVGR